MSLGRGACWDFPSKGDPVNECLHQNLSGTNNHGRKAESSIDRRRLQQSATTVKEVGTGAEFVAAVAQGKKDIVITEHINLTALPLPLKCDAPPYSTFILCVLYNAGLKTPFWRTRHVQR